MSKIYFLIFLSFFFGACISVNTFKKVEIVSVYDGDTFKVNIPCRESILCKNILVRIKGIDCPEIKTKNTYEKQKAREAKSCTEGFIRDKKIVLKNCKRDKYFRLLCDVFIKDKKEEINLTEELLKAKLAVKYDGKTKF